MVLVACGLVFYAAGIATNFFGSTVFSMFFVISYQTAHNTVTYLAVTLAVALGVLALCLVETRETHTDSNSYDEPNEEPNEEPIIVFSPTSTFEMLDNLEKEKT
jgi:mannose/fructose/N-acetylgalactosamine-specific phosphotransferase system component IIC